MQVAVRSLVGACLLGVCVSLGTGCANPIRERAWIGARFDDLGKGWSASVELPGLPAGERAAVVVTQVIPDSPAARAGLTPGDVVLEADGAKLAHAQSLVEHVRDAPPGTDLSLAVLRRGSRQEVPVRLGRERVQREGRLSLGFGLSTKISLWPTDLSLLGLVRCHVGNAGGELYDPVLRARTWNQDVPPPLHTEQGWRIWLLVIGVGRHMKILSQEVI